MRILVTGASGFIGSHIVQALLRTGHEATACVRNTRVRPEDRLPVPWARVDWADPAPVPESEFGPAW